MPTLDFKGKQFVYAHHLTVSARTLKIDVNKSHPSKKPSLDGNLIIHGDNLHALKALMPRYAGRVNCIYIDPPYNTGNEKWLYNDNVNSPMMQNWLKDKGPVDGEDLERHDKWLCMMWPRLQLLRELLAEDGVIFISIDDNEQHRLRMVMDEIFGARNFVATLPTVMNLKGNQDQFAFAGTHEYTTVYANDREKLVLDEFKLSDDELGKWHEDERGFFKQGANLKATGQNAPREKRPYLFFPIYIRKQENGFTVSTNRKAGDTKILPITDNQEMSWRWSKEKFEHEPYNLIVQKTTGGYAVYKKQRPEIGDLPSSKPKTLFYKPEYSSGNGTAQLKRIFGDGRVFANPKPLALIKDIIALAIPDRSGIVLDSFAGSGTTAHAVLALNKEDGGNRKFILVECEDYAHKITAERVRRVIKGVKNAKDENLKNGLGGTFTYCTLGDEISVEKMLTGKHLPDYETFSRHLVYIATGKSPDKIRKTRGKDGFFFETPDRLFYLIYEPELAFLRSTESALNGDRAERIAKQAKTKKKTALVFATHKFMGQKELTEMNITFCQLPFGAN